MTEKDLIQFLKNNLKVELKEKYICDDRDICVQLILGDELIYESDNISI